MSQIFRISLLVLSLIIACNSLAQNTKRPKLQLQEMPVAAEYDTIVPKSGDVVISGFDKAQNSTNESFFVTNNTDYPIDKVNLTLTYYTMSGQQMHRSTQTINVYINEHETRNVNIKSWDRQHLWYYHRTLSKHNGNCTPFDVRAKVNYYLRKYD